MPELPEVEWFRRVLLPLVDARGTRPPLTFELVGDSPPRKWVPTADVAAHTGRWRCADVLRKGKQLCMVLERPAAAEGTGTAGGRKEVGHFYLHMGMTGRLVSPTRSCGWGHKYVKEDEGPNGDGVTWPPRFTYLLLRSGEATVAFADPRKFGACHFHFPDSDGDGDGDGGEPALFRDLAPDALADTATPAQRAAMAATLAGRRLGVKALLLDQKRVASGVGNWVADEILYRREIHPDQAHFTEDEALGVVDALRDVMAVAVDCLDRGVPYPDDWLFGYRWTGKKAGKDSRGRSLSFVTSGGRTSAIVASLQKLQKAGRGEKTAAAGGRAKGKGKGRGQAKKAEMKAEITSKAEAVSSSEPNEGAEIDSKAKTTGRRRTRKVKTKVEAEAKAEAESTTLQAKGEAAAAVAKVEGQKSGPQTRKRTRQAPASGAIHQKDEVAKRQRGASPISTEKKKKQRPKEEERGYAAVLEGVDAAVQDDFRRVGFARWQREWLPAIQLGPYDVPPGPVRDGWMRLFGKDVSTVAAWR